MPTLEARGCGSSRTCLRSGVEEYDGAMYSGSTGTAQSNNLRITNSKLLQTLVGGGPNPTQLSSSSWEWMEGDEYLESESCGGGVGEVLEVLEVLAEGMDLCSNRARQLSRPSDVTKGPGRP